MKTTAEIQAEISRILAEEPACNLLERLWRLAERESQESVLSNIIQLPDSAKAFLSRTIKLSPEPHFESFGNYQQCVGRNAFSPRSVSPM
jgi:hypothetical protein